MPAPWPIRCGRKPIRRSTTSTRSTVYEKGAEVVRMVQTLIGKEKFRAGMDLYFERHDGHAATVEQFIQCFADASGRDMTQFMRWYSQAGTPEVTVAGRFDRRAQDLHARGQAKRAGHARPAHQSADGDPARARPGRPRWPRSAACPVGRHENRARRAGAGRAGGDFRVYRHRRGARAVDQPRLLRADQARHRSRRRRSRLSRRSRQRSVQPLAGAADHRDAAVDRQCGRAAAPASRRATASV